MNQVSQNQIKRARQVDLVTYLKTFELENLVKISEVNVLKKIVVLCIDDDLIISDLSQALY